MFTVLILLLLMFVVAYIVCHRFSSLNHYCKLFVGVSDDAISCALMMEVLHLLTQQTTPLKHSIVFVFNGAEENILQV